MNTDNANKYLDTMQINDRSVWDSKDIEHPLDCLLEDYHQEQLKLLGIADVVGQSEQLKAFLTWLEKEGGSPFIDKDALIDNWLKSL